MLTSYKMTIKNTKEFISPDDMFRILYVVYLESINIRKERKQKIFDRGKLTYAVNEHGSEYYKILIGIFLSRKIFDFLYWKPYVKTINMYRLTRKLMSEMRLNWSSRYHGHREIPFRTNDHKINILWHLHERGMTFESLMHIPKFLRKFTRGFLYTDYYLDKIFESDYKESRMNMFSNNPEETWLKRWHYDRYGRYQYRQHNIHYDYADVDFDSHEFNQQHIDTHGTIGTVTNVTQNTMDTANYQLYINTADNGTADVQRVVYASNNDLTSATTANTGTLWSIQ